MTYKGILYIISVTVLCWLILVPVANSLSIPLGSTFGIISRVVIEDRSPLTNVAIYLLLLLPPSFVILLLEFLKTQEIKFISIIVRKATLIYRNFKSSVTTIVKSKIFLPTFSLLLVTCWILNTTQHMLIPNLVQDGFHYGEKIGLSKTFLSNPTDFYHKAYLMIHGFGQNVLPGVIGFLLGGYKLDIAFSYLVVYSQVFLAIVFSFLILLEISAYISENNKWKVFFILTLVYFALYGPIFTPIDRDTIFFLQALITIRWIRLFANSDTSDDFLLRYRLIYPISIGSLIPISIFYVYDRAVYFIVLFAYLLFYIAIVKSRNFFLKSTLFALASILITSIILSLIFGFESLPISIAQILYWSKVSGLFTSLPYPKITLASEVVTWLPILVQSLTITILCLKFRTECFSLGKKFKVFFLENGVPIFILLCAVMFMRVALGRSDGGHLISPGFFAIFSFIAVLGKQIAQQQIYKISWFSTFIAIVIICSIINLKSVGAAVSAFSVVNYPSSVTSLLSSKSSDLISSEYNEAAQQLKGDVAGQSCFYTLTSEGIWYRIFQLKPCSKYWYLIYSTSTASQQELVKELQNEKPKIILYSNQSLSNGIDGVPKETSHLLVHQYIWQNYRPYKYVNNNWFWIRRDPAIQLSELLVTQPNDTVGAFDSLSSLDSNNKLDAMASGWTLLPLEQLANANAIFLTYNLVSLPNELKLLALGSVSVDRPDVAAAINNTTPRLGWNISFNKLNIPSKKIVNIRAWAYNSTDQKLYEIPSSSVKTIEGK